ncbi:nuclease SbcCD subunit D [Desulfuromonas versatilis]|uniref:Nuclease SbcCD subunit D n=1 Tax=Desulfuromonas versatilis TaxID=2802975 RepID=A0ABM8HSF4_9BACT|nr:exonuclease SbcCD subunit D [Desulfuromonas versatilis]BCR03898.1 nuclease SbcCD subunit D [Desulfuromonas versatilis]
MRFLHTSDWHIGRQFHNISLLEDQRHVLRQIVDLVRERQVDAVIVAGDIYDRSVPPAAAVALLDETVNRICNELQVPMILIAGNHDGPERLAFGARQLAGAGLHVVGPLWRRPRPVLLKGRHGEVAFYPVPYADPATVRNLHQVEVASHDAAMAHLLEQVRSDNPPGRPCVVIAHCFLAGGETSESERPLNIGGADQVSADYFRDFAYAALGHLHGPQFRGAEHIRYSGSPLKYSFSEERQRKAVTLVELDAAGQAAIEQIPLRPLRDMRVVEGALDELLAKGKNDPRREDYLLVRLSDTHAILDVMNKLREVYPNVLHLERPGLMSRSERLEMSRERLKRGEMAMFEDFFRQVTGEGLSAEQEKALAACLETLHREGGN